nr:DNA polymerase [Paludisphaera mucosa]
MGVAEDLGRSIELPRTAGGKVSVATKAWASLAPSHPFVGAWIELERTSSLLRSAAAVRGPCVRPTYAPLVRTGRCSCSGPNVQALPRRGGIREAFVAPPGRLFLIVDYSCAELRTLAAVCEARYGASRLADVLRAGDDPHAHTAAVLAGVAPVEFAAWRTGSPGDRGRFDELRRRAKAVNFGIPGGLGSAALAEYARSSFGVAMTQAEARALRELLVAEVYPELRLYLADGEDSHRGEGMVGGPRGRSSPPGVATPTGRVRGRVGYSQARNTPFQGLAADGAKLALWALTREGYRVAAFIHDEFVVELPEEGVDHLAEARRIEAILDRAMEEVTPGIPSACDFALARRWSKDARAAFSPDGRLVPWEDGEASKPCSSPDRHFPRREASSIAAPRRAAPP